MNWRVLLVAVAFGLFVLALGWLRAPGAHPGAAKSGVPFADSGHAAPGIAPRRADPAHLPAAGEWEIGVGTVRGRVVDDLGEPVTGGSVSAVCLTSDGAVRPMAGGAVSLGDDGTFSMPGCEGQVCIELHHTSVIRADAWIVEAGRFATLLARHFERLEGRVEDPSGGPVAGARVVAVPGVEDEPAALPPYSATTTSTDEEGFFSFARIERAACDPCTEARAGCPDPEQLPTWSRVRITARAPGFGVSDVEIDPDDAGPTTITLRPPGPPLEGTVRPRPAGELSVLVRSDQRSYEVHGTSVDEGGSFRVEGLGEGTYSLRVIHAGAEVGVAHGVRAGARIHVALTAP